MARLARPQSTKKCCTQRLSLTTAKLGCDRSCSHASLRDTAKGLDVTQVRITEVASLAKLSSWQLVAETEALPDGQAVGGLVWIPLRNQHIILVGDATNSTLQLWEVQQSSSGEPSENY